MFSSRDRFVFHHIPKTGGTSALGVFGSWFNLVRDYEDPTMRHRFLDHPVNLSALGPPDLLCGHFCAPGSRLPERYPEVVRPGAFQLLTMLRDPLDTMVSLYHYEQRVGYTDRDMPIEAYLDEKPDNLLASYFPCDEGDYAEVLGRYAFIGLVERMQESFDYLADLLGKPRILVPRANAHEGPPVTVTPGTVRAFRERNALDYALYSYAQARFPPARLGYAMTLGGVPDWPDR